MKIEIDTHCHTIASGHAYSTVMELAEFARKKGLKGLALTDHAPKMPGSSDIYYIKNQVVIPNNIDGIDVLKGVEVDIIDYNGGLDIDDDLLSRLDIVIASLHGICLEPGTKKENTRTLLKTMENKNVDIIGHSGNPQFPIDKEAFVKAAKEANVLVEINNSSFLSSREGSYENCEEIAKLCSKHDVKITLGSDCHIAFDVGRSDMSVNMLEDINFNEELVVNTSKEKLYDFLRSRGRKRFL